MNTQTTAQEYLQTIPTDILAAAARGEINLNQLAQDTLANRGLNSNGAWVGFNAPNTQSQADNHA